jgi:hypothetical protein
MINDLIDIPISMCPMSNSTITTRGATQKFQHNTKNYQNHFIPAVISLWNGLPSNVSNISDPDAFKRALLSVRLTNI